MYIKLAIAKEDDDTKWTSDRIDYLPFGVKTLKVVLSGDYAGPVYLAPKRRSTVPGEQFAYEDEGTPQFVISWGGGKEDYCEVDYPQNRFAYFLVHHQLNSNPGNYVLTIQARDAKTPDAKLLDELQVTLTYPRTEVEPYPLKDLIRPEWIVERKGLSGSSNILLGGSYAPEYIPRWWPHNRVNYSSEEPPSVRVHFQRQKESSQGALEIFTTPVKSVNEVLLAEIQGRLDYPLYDMRQVLPELYHFGPHAWVLRLWYFWLDLDLSREDLSRYGCLAAADVEVAWKGVNPQGTEVILQRAWRNAHEVPDAERIDILFDDQARPLYAATDLHWREMWGDVCSHGEPIKAKILNTVVLDTDKHWPQDAKQVFEEWWLAITGMLANNHREPPYKPYKEVRCVLEGKVPLAANVLMNQTHTPAFLNVNLQTRFTSSDVREG
jgi:hypothetical protein